jgi:hypothetical protein
MMSLPFLDRCPSVHSDSWGIQKGGGNTKDGMLRWNGVLQRVAPHGEKQRDHLGCTFEHDLLTALAIKPSRGRANDTESQPSKARIHVSELMQIVGV